MPINNPSVLLDTHAWVWAVAGDTRAERLKGFSGRCAVSVISIWEIRMLEAKGSLELQPVVSGAKRKP